MSEPQIFVFTASNRAARDHIDDSIASPISVEICDRHVPSDLYQRVRQESEDGQPYAWGATPGPQNKARWARLNPGDWVLTYQSKRYTFLSRVIEKAHLPEFARALWGDDGQGNTWEYAYFLQPPVAIDIPVDDLTPYLSGTYMGFSRAADSRLSEITRDYGSVDAFVEQRIRSGADVDYLLIKQTAASEWDDKEGELYHYANTVPNSRKIKPGGPFVLQMKDRLGKRLVARGKFGAVEQTRVDENNRKHFEARYAVYEPIRPPRVVTKAVEALLAEHSSFNVQNAVLPLYKETYQEITRPAQAWIFQANPSLYDVRAACAKLEGRRVTWEVNQSKNEIDVGHRVYLWEAGPSGGIVGVGEVVSGPEQMEMLPEERPFVKDQERFTGAKLGVIVLVRKSLQPVLSRQELQSHPLLQDLGILKFANATNFKVTPDHAEELERLIDGQGGIDSLVRDFERQMILYRDSGVVFASLRQRALYSVESCDDAGCSVDRLTGKDPQRVTFSGCRTLIDRMQEAGGRLPFDQFFAGTVATQTAYFQAPCFAATVDGDEVELVRTMSSAERLFRGYVENLNVDRSGESPRLYKPLLLYGLLTGIDSGDLVQNQFRFDDLLGFFHEAAALCNQEVTDQHAAYAFYHMTGEPFWLLAHKNPPDALGLGERVSPTRMREDVSHARLKEPFWSLVADDERRHRIMRTLETHWLGIEPTQPMDVPNRVERLQALLENERPQMILYGPPGTSKTHTALEVVAAMAGVYDTTSHPADTIRELQFQPEFSPSEGQRVTWDIVQFHSSYGYEDFVTGIDAATVEPEDGGPAQLTFSKEPRIFLQMVQAARAHADIQFVLIIDEINRGVLGRIFGELILTLEYRDKLPVRLPGQSEVIHIPDNLFLIGTMNTADRNIALVDHALRRRFLFVPAQPNEGLLRGFFADDEVQQRNLAVGCFNAVQSGFWGAQEGSYEVDPRGYDLSDYAVGHTYFMKSTPDELLINLRYQVLPLLAEYAKEGVLTEARLRLIGERLEGALGGVQGDDAQWIGDWAQNWR